MTPISLLAGLTFALTCFPRFSPAVTEVPEGSRALLGVVVTTRTVTVDGRQAFGLAMKTEGSARTLDFIHDTNFTPYGIGKGARVVVAGLWDGEQLWGSVEPAGDASLEGEFDYFSTKAGAARLDFELYKDLGRLKRLKKGRVALLRRLAGHPQFIGEWSDHGSFISLVQASLSDPKLQAFVIGRYEILREEHARAALEAQELIRTSRETDYEMGLVTFTLLWIMKVIIHCVAAIWIKRFLSRERPLFIEAGLSAAKF